MLADTEIFIGSMYPQKGWIPNIVFCHTEGSSIHQDILYGTRGPEAVPPSLQILPLISDKRNCGETLMRNKCGRF